MNKTFISSSLVSLLAIILLSACDSTDSQPTTHAAPPAPKVSVAQVISQRVTPWDEFTGRLQAPQTVALRPRVSGYIEQVVFAEGELVTQGQTLFKIDSSAFIAQVDRLQAEVVDAKSRSVLAQLELKRGQRLKKTQAISQEELDNRQGRYQQSLASVQARQAALSAAQIELGYTTVKAPISGRVSRALITKGNYVTAGQSELTTLVSTDKIYAYFDVDERTYLKYSQQIREGSRPQASEHKSPVLMGLAVDNSFPYSGHINFIDNQINPKTGTMGIRAVFDNLDGRFTPGSFARIKLIGSASYQGILIDDKAVGTDLNNKFVMILDQHNTVQYRAVTLGQKQQSLRLISQGLKAGDTVVINGLQRIRPGITVDPTVVPMANDTTIAKLKQLQQRVDVIQTPVELVRTPRSSATHD
ncbi:MAG: efflux RND transporter periplasmic adaptor subunit [Gammaproteobacteria bacterium]|nr:efflux RND transporter periplasmic adaptor subunit [Gammaproteobacteria bacterium]